MNQSAKENVKLILISLAFFFTQIVCCGTFYGEATDTFWIQNLSQQGITDYQVFYVGVGHLLGILFHHFKQVPWNSLLLYGMLFSAYVLAVKLLNRGFNSLFFLGVVFLLLFSDPLLLLDFTQVAILTSVVVLLCLGEMQAMKWYTYLFCLLLLFSSFLLRSKSVVFAGVLLLPYFVFRFRVLSKKRFVLPFFACFSVFLFLKLSPSIQSYSHQNSVRAKLSDYQLKISTEGFSEHDLFELECVSAGLPMGSLSSGVRQFAEELSVVEHLNISKAKHELFWLGKRLVGSYGLLLMALLGLLYSYQKWRNVLLVGYVFGVLLVVACFLKLPDRLLQPALVALLLMVYVLRETNLIGRFKIILFQILLVLCVLRLGFKSFELNKIQNRNEEVLQVMGVKGTIRSTNISNRIMYLNPLKTYSECSVSHTIPLTGWVGLLPQVVSRNNEINIIQTEGSVFLIERWLGKELVSLNVTTGLYIIKKDTSN